MVLSIVASSGFGRVNLAKFRVAK